MNYAMSILILGAESDASFALNKAECRILLHFTTLAKIKKDDTFIV